jgi:hypothetical protein|tara:strand:- start:1351 stop:1557 length:207 start_codon:yes stop_codon:yes gene_type:complete
LKFGVVVVVAQAIHAVTVVRLLLAVLVETTVQRQLIQVQDANTVYAPVVHGHVVSHTLVVQVWVVKVM